MNHLTARNIAGLFFICAFLFVGSSLSLAQTDSVTSVHIDSDAACTTYTRQLFITLSDTPTSNEITSLQEDLGVRTTGYFGPLTQAAVRVFQSQNDIPTTGTVGPLTRSALNSQFGCDSLIMATPILNTMATSTYLVSLGSLNLFATSTSQAAALTPTMHIKSWRPDSTHLKPGEMFHMSYYGGIAGGYYASTTGKFWTTGKLYNADTGEFVKQFESTFATSLDMTEQAGSERNWNLSLKAPMAPSKYRLDFTLTCGTKHGCMEGYTPNAPRATESVLFDVEIPTPSLRVTAPKMNGKALIGQNPRITWKGTNLVMRPGVKQIDMYSLKMVSVEAASGGAVGEVYDIPVTPSTWYQSGFNGYASAASSFYTGWNVDDSVPPGMYKLIVTCAGCTDETKVEGESSPFTVLAREQTPSFSNVQISAESGGDTVKRGENVKVTWDSTHMSPSQIIDIVLFSKDSDSEAFELAVNSPTSLNTGTFVGTIPWRQPIGPNGRVLDFSVQITCRTCDVDSGINPYAWAGPIHVIEGERRFTPIETVAPDEMPPVEPEGDKFNQGTGESPVEGDMNPEK
jgi:hypothetical protein